jgi:phytanoyl-CoA hydroxylase
VYEDGSTAYVEIMPNVTITDLELDVTEKLRQAGYFVLRGFYDVERHLDGLYREINAISEFFSNEFEPFGLFCTESIAEEDRSRIYKALRYMPGLFALASNEKNIELCQNLGLKLPALMHSCNIRMDLPDREEFIFHWHQDLTYLLGSMNAVTFWIPLTDVNRERGTIEIIPGSHKEGILPIRYTGDGKPEKTRRMSPKDIYLQDIPNHTTEYVNAKPGDLVVFSQLLLHRSTLNPSNRIRWAVQLRYADFSEPRFIQNNYPMGDATNVFYTDYLDC